MMDARELRVGNFIQQPNGLNQVFAIDIETINSYEFEFIAPVPITEQWLVTFGFKKKDDRDYLFPCKESGTNYSIHFNRLSSEIHSVGIYDNEGNMLNFVWHIKYVHQLQNIYFALTGTELKYDH